MIALVIDDISRHIQNDVAWCLSFADDIVLIDETRAGITIS